ncbi:MAG: hypothetical protein ACK4GT_15610, partial [Pararhodobacter sp.]
MSSTTIRRAKQIAASRRFWMLALVPALTVVAVAAGLPVWALSLLIILQGGLLWSVLRTKPGSGAVVQTRLRDRADLQALLQQQATES